MATTSRSSRRPVYLILFAALAAAAGNGISLIAFPWLVLQHNGSALDASIVAGATSLPLLFSTLIAGAAVDYLGLRRVSLISDALSAATVAAVPVLAIIFGQGSITVGVLAMLAASDDVSGAGHSDDRDRPGVASTFLAPGVGRVLRHRVSSGVSADPLAAGFAAVSVGSRLWARMCWPA